MPQVSPYRKYIHTYSQLITAGPGVVQNIFIDQSDGVMLVKNIRGYVTVSPVYGSEDPNSRNLAGGWFGLVRYPRSETLGSADVLLASSRVLHPVAFSCIGYPTTFYYEHVGVNVGQFEKLYIAFVIGTGAGTISVCSSLLYNAKYEAVAPN